MNFPHPMRGIAALMLIIIVAPPVFVAVAAVMGHHFADSRQILFELGELARQHIVPQIMPGYSIFMPPVFLAAAWCGCKAANGAALSLIRVILPLLIATLGCEVLFQAIIVLSGAPWRPGFFAVDIVQAIIAGFICRLIGGFLKLAKPAV